MMRLQDEVVVTIDIKGCSVKNASLSDEYKFIVEQPDGTKHVFKLEYVIRQEL